MKRLILVWFGVMLAASVCRAGDNGGIGQARSWIDPGRGRMIIAPTARPLKLFEVKMIYQWPVMFAASAGLGGGVSVSYGVAPYDLTYVSAKWVIPARDSLNVALGAMNFGSGHDIVWGGRPTFHNNDYSEDNPLGFGLFYVASTKETTWGALNGVAAVGRSQNEGKFTGIVSVGMEQNLSSSVKSI
ncbi:MAG: hypothetical protein NTV51_30485, partial [Verrucomicrobia bacterium]|nr:hypothetical protein [Verrucomicrobiota bacterium]